MTPPRFHLPAARPGPFVLPEGAFIHAARVLRLQEGDALRVFDAGREFDATITSVGKRRVEIEVGAPADTASERSVALHLIMSPLKGDLTELVIQKATELGVARIWPVVFERTDTVARRDPGEGRLERWRRVAVGASEQSGRTVVPELWAPVALGEAINELGQPDDGELRIVASEPSLGQGNTAFPTEPRIRRVVLAVGPAGGISGGDLNALRSAGFAPLSLARHTLRAETACIAGIAILASRYPS